MRIFITGATGFVGRNFLTWLLMYAPEAEIICLVRDSEKARAQWRGNNLPGGPVREDSALRKRLASVCWLQGNLLAPEGYAAEVRRAERVFHIASLVSLRNGPEFYKQNPEATRCLIAALQAEKSVLQRLVVVSSISAIDRDLAVTAAGPLTEASPPHPNTDYGRSKWLAEEWVRNSGLPYTILRPAYIYGPYPRAGSSMDRMLRDTLAGKPYTRFPWPGRASAVHAEDLAAMLWTASAHPAALNETFFACHPEPVRIAEAFALLAEALDVPFEPRAFNINHPQRFSKRLYQRHPANPVPRILMEDAFLCSSEKFICATGFQPRYDLHAGIRQAIDWLRANGQL